MTWLTGGAARLAGTRRRYGWPALVPAVVLAEVLPGDHRRDHAVNRILRICQVVPVDEPTARLAARLRTDTGRASSLSATDAVVAATAAMRSDPVVLTGDPRDLAALAAHADRPIVVVAV